MLDTMTLAALRPNRTWTQVAQLLNSKPSTVRSFAARHGLTQPRTAGAGKSKPVTRCYDAWMPSQLDVAVLPPPNPIPDSISRVDTTPLHLTGESCLAIGDLHIPHHNEELLWRAIKLVQQRFPSVTRLILGGDLWDFAILSTYAHTAPEPDPNTSIRLGGNVLRALGQSFKEIVICSGNHDERVARKLDVAWDLELLINAALGKMWPTCDLKITNLDYVFLGDHWLIGHPKNYSGRGGQTPSDLADIYQRSVITFHNHIVGLQPSKSGAFWGIDAGHCTRPDQHYYLMRRLTKFTRWQAGFVVIENGYPHLFADALTNWPSWIKE